MSDDDDEIRKLLGQPATKSLMLLLGLALPCWWSLSWRSATPVEWAPHAIVRPSGPASSSPHVTAQRLEPYLSATAIGSDR